MLGMTLSPCRRYQPRRSGSPRRHPCDDPCCLRLKREGSAFGLQYFRGHMGLLSLRPGDSLTIPRWLRQWASGLSVSLLPAIQATGRWLLPRWDSLPLFMPAFAGRTLFGYLSDLGECLLARSFSTADRSVRGKMNFFTSSWSRFSLTRICVYVPMPELCEGDAFVSRDRAH